MRIQKMCKAGNDYNILLCNNHIYFILYIVFKPYANSIMSHSFSSLWFCREKVQDEGTSVIIELMVYYGVLEIKYV